MLTSALLLACLVGALYALRAPIRRALVRRALAKLGHGKGPRIPVARRGRRFSPEAIKRLQSRAAFCRNWRALSPGDRDLSGRRWNLREAARRKYPDDLPSQLKWIAAQLQGERARSRVLRLARARGPLA